MFAPFREFVAPVECVSVRRTLHVTTSAYVPTIVEERTVSSVLCQRFAPEAGLVYFPIVDHVIVPLTKDLTNNVTHWQVSDFEPKELPRTYFR